MPNRVYEHHLVYCLEHGLTEIPEGYVVHHKDGDKLNNHPSNLDMMTFSAHTSLHMSQNLSGKRDD